MIVEMPAIWNFDELGKAVLTQWYASEGDTVKEGNPVCQIMAAKVTVEVASPYSGKITKLIAIINEEISPGDPLMEIQ